MTDERKKIDAFLKKHEIQNHKVLLRVPEYAQTNTLKGLDYDLILSIIDVETTGY